ncbi:MAG: hypothetical protein F6K28_15255 [Microcoleus sp. SIO2G3]|nr:hypothetical protein [Microcoleus sp. SIO2G3]
MQVGEKLSAIVKAPDDQTSRYVSAGEYLSKGQVLVKRIELDRCTTPRQRTARELKINFSENSFQSL